MNKREIDVRDQAQLSVRKVVELVRSGIAHRLLRSTLTMSVILLAVAFFMFSLTENAILVAVGKGVDQEITEQRSAPYLLSHLYNRKNGMQVADYLGRRHQDQQAQAEAAAVADWEQDRVRRLANWCWQETRYLRWFYDLSPGKRIALVGRHQQRAILKHLVDPEAWDAFVEQIDLMSDVRVVGSRDALRSFLDELNTYYTELQAFVQAWSDAISRLTVATEALTGETPRREWLATSDDAAFERWQNAVTAVGFSPQPRHLARLREDLAHQLRIQDIRQQLGTAQAQSDWMRLFKYRASTEEKLTKLTDSRMIELLDQQYDAQQLHAAARVLDYEQRLARLETQLSVVLDSKDDSGLLSGRQIFLLAISFVVCMVGIANAMLMAITERFREIATMKCLGATDGFILEQFMIEAAIQGVAGGVLGMLIGFLLTFGKLLLLYGAYPLYYFPLGAVLLCAVVSLVSGVVLSMLASIYPSYSASRMAPMEAMRVE